MRELCNHLLFLRCNPINSEMKMLSGALFSRSPAALPHAQSVHHNKRHNIILKFNHHIVCFLKTILLNPKSEEFWTDRPITVASEGVLPLQTQGTDRPITVIGGSPGSWRQMLVLCFPVMPFILASSLAPRSHLPLCLSSCVTSGAATVPCRFFCVRPSAANACWAGCWKVLYHASRLFEAWVKGKVMGNDVLSHF